MATNSIENWPLSTKPLSINAKTLANTYINKNESPWQTCLFPVVWVLREYRDSFSHSLVRKWGKNLTKLTIKNFFNIKWRLKITQLKHKIVESSKSPRLFTKISNFTTANEY